MSSRNHVKMIHAITGDRDRAQEQIGPEHFMVDNL